MPSSHERMAQNNCVGVWIAPFIVFSRRRAAKSMIRKKLRQRCVESRYAVKSFAGLRRLCSLTGRAPPAPGLQAGDAQLASGE
jgi:hypothetical protein